MELYSTRYLTSVKIIWLRWRINEWKKMSKGYMLLTGGQADVLEEKPLRIPLRENNFGIFCFVSWIPSFVLSLYLSLRVTLSLLSRLVPLSFPLQHTTQSFLPPAEFELAIPASERPQTHALYGGATGIGWNWTQTSTVRGQQLIVWAMAQSVNGRCVVYCEQMFAATLLTDGNKTNRRETWRC
jgi:hypothetical protein